jgi:hypothetical protein
LDLGCLAQQLPPPLGYDPLTSFLVSGLLRGVVLATLLRRISEVRHVANMSTAELLFGTPSFAQVKSGGVWQPLFFL